MMDKLKNAHKSLTVWFNSMLLAALPLYELFQDQLATLQAYLPDNIYKYIGVAVVLINIGLRFKTNKSLADK